VAISITETVGNAYNKFFKNNTLLIIGIVGTLVVGGTSLVFSAMITGLFKIPSTSVSAAIAVLLSPIFWIETVVFVVVSALVGVFIAGALISAAADGDKATIGSAVGKSASRYISLLGTCVISDLVAFLAFVPSMAMFLLAVLSISGGASSVVLFMILGFILMIIPAYVTLRLSLAEAVCVVGGRRAIDSVMGSWSMLRGSLWQIFGILFVVGIIGGIVGGIISILIRPLGSLVEMLLSYPGTVALVLVYMQLAGPSGMSVKSAKRQ
jgi:hypothetical protein